MNLGMSAKLWLVILSMTGLVALGCSDDNNNGDGDTDTSTGGDGDTDNDTDADTDNDTDADTDNDTDSDTDNDTDADTDSDTDSDTDNDTDSDTDNDTDADTDNDTDADTDNDTDTDTDNDTDTDTDNDTDTDTDNDTDTDTDTDSDTDTDTDTDSDTDTDTDSDTDIPVSTLDDLDIIVLDEMPEARVHIYGSNSQGSNAYSHEDVTVRYWNFHAPYPKYGQQTLHLADIDSNNAGWVFFRLPEDEYEVQLMGFQVDEPGIDDTGLAAPDSNADRTACFFGTTETTFGCNGFEAENIPTLENVFRFNMPPESEIDGYYLINKQANRLNFNISLETEGFPKTLRLDTVNIRVFATDENGLPDQRGELIHTNGQLVDLAYVNSDDEPLSQQFTSSVEVFEGFYRAIVTGTAHSCVDDEDGYPDDCTESGVRTVDVYPFVSDVITSDGSGGSMSVTAELNSNDNDNEITLTLIDATNEGDPSVPDDGMEYPIEDRQVRVYDCQTGWYLNDHYSGATGETVVPIGNVTKVVAVANLNPFLALAPNLDPATVADPSRYAAGSGGYVIDVTSDPSKTIKEKLLRGRVSPSAAIQDMPVTTVTMVQRLDDCVNPNDYPYGGKNAFVGRVIYPRTASPSLGYFDNREDGDDGDEIRVWGAALEGTVAGLVYDVTVQNLQDDYFLLTSVEEVVSDADGQEKNITVHTGGFLAGKVTRTPGNANMPDIYITAISDEGLGTNIDFTDETGDYIIPLPAGIYTVWVGNMPFTPVEIDHDAQLGFARTDEVVIVEDETTELNFVYGPYSGRVENTEGVEVDGASMPGSGRSDPTDDGGNYTYEFWTGVNWVCANPKTSDDGDNLEYKCFYEIAVGEDDFQ